MAEHYSPLRYPGGKARLSKFLAAVIRGNSLRRPTYVEPYAGGAGAAIRLLCEEYVECIVINDADPRIRSFWLAVTQQTERFIDRIASVPITVEEWHLQRSIYNKRDLRRTFDLGFATFFLNRTSRSGIIHNGGPIGGYDQTGNYKIDARFTRKELVRRVNRVGAYGDRISVRGADGLELLREVDADSLQAQSTFVYLDPPYYGKSDKLYLNRFTHTEHAMLAEFLRPSRRFAWMMTYDDVEPIRRLYRGHCHASFSLSYSAFERRDGAELLIHPSSICIPDNALAALPALAS